MILAQFAKIFKLIQKIKLYLIFVLNVKKLFVINVKKSM